MVHPAKFPKRLSHVPTVGSSGCPALPTAVHTLSMCPTGLPKWRLQQQQLHSAAYTSAHFVSSLAQQCGVCGSSGCTALPTQVHTLSKCPTGPLHDGARNSSSWTMLSTAVQHAEPECRMTCTASQAALSSMRASFSSTPGPSTAGSAAHNVLQAGFKGLISLRPKSCAIGPQAAFLNLGLFQQHMGAAVTSLQAETGAG